MKPGVGLIGKKLGMTQVFREDGRTVAVTVLEAGPCAVVAEKTLEKDGYRAVQVGFDSKKYLKEFRIGKDEKVEAGSTVTVEIFKAGDRVDITGRSIGKGFSGGMKRWHWKGGRQTHGSMTHRRPGSIGSSTTPSRVFRGHHMPGHMGDKTVTTLAMEVVRVDAEKNLLLLKGSVPGGEKAIVYIRKSVKPPKKVVVHTAVKKKAAQPEKGGAKPAAAKAGAKK
jgi:large subunit ribosomal protein L3